MSDHGVNLTVYDTILISMVEYSVFTLLLSLLIWHAKGLAIPDYLCPAHTSSYQTTETGIHPTSLHLFTSLWRILWRTVRCQSKPELISLDLVHHPNLYCVVVLSGIYSKHVLDEFPYSGCSSALETTGTVPPRF